MARTVLDELAHRSRFAVVTMTGTCCPITLAHVQLFIEARRLLLNEFGFDAVVGGLSLNSDTHVSNKLAAKGLDYIRLGDRKRLAKLAMQEHDWLQLNEQSEKRFAKSLQDGQPQLIMTHYRLNGADDVIKYRKWHLKHPQIVICRPGSTQKLRQALHDAKVDTTSGIFVVGPELEDISSSHVRDALLHGERHKLLSMLHPDVASWCWDHGPYRPRGMLKNATVLRSGGTKKTLLRKIATHRRIEAAWVESRKVVRNGETVKMLFQEADFTWVQTSDGIGGFLKTKYLKCGGRRQQVRRLVRTRHFNKHRV